MTARTATHSGLRPKHAPQRTCVGCGTVTAKRALVRIVRGPEGEVRPDTTGKAPGRGTYLHASRSCWESGLNKKRLERSLKVTLAPASREALSAYAMNLPEETGS
jgi:uncharacterized protein